MLADVLDQAVDTHRPAPAPHRTVASRRRAALVALVTAVLTALALAGPVRPAAAQGPGTATILAQVNASRAAAGLRPLALASDLSSVAYAWSRHMATTTVLAHNPNLTGQVDDWQVVGENVGYGPTVTDVETAFMNSPRHRANILEPRYTQIGLGVVVDAQGTSWITQVFRKPMSSTTAPTAATPKTTSRQPTSTSASTSASTSTKASAKAPARATTAATPRASAPARATARSATPAALSTARPVPAQPTPSAAPSSSAADPGQLLAQRLAAAAAARPDTAADPIDAALGWAAAMDALAG
ncbi:MAG TPA: CAP domain-containing protein [Motilibacteraceae bacterium]|nr:CAP domain-containing protein [Motilibacteraceae bacterium]